jgi:hypothetical protein
LEWEHKFLFGNGLQTITILPYPGGCTASYNALNDRIEGCCYDSPNGSFRALLDLSFVETHITRVVARTVLADVRFSVNDKFQIWDGDRDTGDLLVEYDVGMPGNNNVDTGAISIMSTQLQFDFAQATTNPTCPDPDAELYVVEILVYGTGADPFV